MFSVAHGAIVFAPREHVSSHARERVVVGVGCIRVFLSTRRITCLTAVGNLKQDARSGG